MQEWTLWRVCGRESLFGPMRDELIETVRALNAQPGFLNKFEIAQIMYLRPERVEVAVALIPR